VAGKSLQSLTKSNPRVKRKATVTTAYRTYLGTKRFHMVELCAYYMVERFIKLQQAVCAALIKLQRQDLMPQDSEVSTIEVYQTVMKLWQI